VRAVQDRAPPRRLYDCWIDGKQPDYGDNRGNDDIHFRCIPEVGRYTPYGGGNAEISMMGAEESDWRLKLLKTATIARCLDKPRKFDRKSNKEEHAEIGDSPTEPKTTESVTTAASQDKPQKYDRKSKKEEAAEIGDSPTEPKTTESVTTAAGQDKPQKYDWRSKIKEATGIAKYSTEGEEQDERGFKKTIANMIKAIEEEQRARHEREAVERAKLEKARNKAVLIRDTVVMPLLTRLRDDFAAHERRVLPEWQVQCGSQTDRYFGEARTSSLDGSGTTCFVVKAEACVADAGEFIDLSVESSAVNFTSASASTTTSLFEKRAKFPIVWSVEMGIQLWFHEYMAECARLCALMRLRQIPPQQGYVSVAYEETSGETIVGEKEDARPAKDSPMTVQAVRG
jgi:hypothetical protein